MFDESFARLNCWRLCADWLRVLRTVGGNGYLRSLAGRSGYSSVYFGWAELQECWPDGEQQARVVSENFREGCQKSINTSRFLHSESFLLNTQTSQEQRVGSSSSKMDHICSFWNIPFVVFSCGFPMEGLAEVFRVRKRVVSKRVPLADVPGPQSWNEGTKKRNDSTKNRNEGTEKERRYQNSERGYTRQNRPFTEPPFCFLSMKEHLIVPCPAECVAGFVLWIV